MHLLVRLTIRLRTHGKVEGIFTMLVSLLLLVLLPGSPDEPRPLLSPGIVRFSPDDQRVLQIRQSRDHGKDAGGGK